MPKRTAGKGKPSGNAPMQGTGTPAKTSDKNMQNDQELTEKYTKNDNEIADSVRTEHPNRNVNKGDATGGGGYRN